MKQIKELFVIQEAGLLMQMPRSHKRTLGTATDTIASHSFHVALIAYIIAKMEGLSEEEAQKACTIGVFHDLAEARTGDHDFITKKYNIKNEEEASHDQLGNIDTFQGIYNSLEEYEERKIPVTQCVKDADQVAQMYQERLLSRQGNKLAQMRREGSQEKRIPFLFTNSAKKIMEAMKKSNPQERWWYEFVENNYSQKDLTGTNQQ